jgi:cellulose synthase/poly-beta-1,6-N-acetylglucosamine synthase-like glycosyltransferase
VEQDRKPSPYDNKNQVLIPSYNQDPTLTKIPKSERKTKGIFLPPAVITLGLESRLQI